MLAEKAATAKTHQVIGIRYAKSCSQLCMVNQAIGEAMMIAMATSFKNSLVSRFTIFGYGCPQHFTNSDFPRALHGAVRRQTQ